MVILVQEFHGALRIWSSLSQQSGMVIMLLVAESHTLICFPVFVCELQETVNGEDEIASRE